MKKIFKCTVAGTYFINGVNKEVAKGDSVVLDSREALKYENSFALAKDWNLLFDVQTIPNAGGAITKTKTFFKEDLSEWDGMGNLKEVEKDWNVKVLTITTTVSGTMPAGAVITLDVLDDNGTSIENKYEVSGNVTNSTNSFCFTSSYLNEGHSYTITVTVPEGNPDVYDLTVAVNEIFPAQIKSVSVESNGLVSGVNTVTLKAKDVKGDGVIAGIFDCYIASNPSGAPAPATTINGIADGGAGDIIEFADDQYIQIFTDNEGSCQIAMTPTDAGTPTLTKLTFAVGGVTTGDIVKFGDEIYEFTTDETTELTLPTNIRIDMTGGGGKFDVVVDAETSAKAFKFVFDKNTQHKVATSVVGAVITFTAIEKFVEYNDLETVTTVTAPSTGVFEDTTFGGGTGDSIKGVDPAVFYYLAVKYDIGKMFISQRLPWQA